MRKNEQDVTKLLEDLEQSDAQTKKTMQKYYDHYFTIYDNCDHLVVKSGDDYDSMEGRHHFHYGCIKCGLNTHAKDGYYGPAYDLPYSVMSEYFNSRGCYLGWLKQYEINISGGYLEQKFVRLCDIYQKLPKQYKELSNDEIVSKINERLKQNSSSSRKRTSKNVK